MSPGWIGASFRPARARVLVVVDNFHLVRILVPPAEAQPPLVVDADAMLAGAVTWQLLQAIARRYPEIVQVLRGVKNKKLPKRGTLQSERPASNGFALEHPARDVVLEALDHR